MEKHEPHGTLADNVAAFVLSLLLQGAGLFLATSKLAPFWQGFGVLVALVGGISAWIHLVATVKLASRRALRRE